MNWIEKILHSLQGTMDTPIPYGWFHLLWIGITFLCIIILFIFKKKCTEKQLKIVLTVYGIVTLFLELAKQLIWSFNYDLATNLVTWNYQWYAFPFQFCTSPLFVSLICLFLKDSKIRNALLSYMAFISILGGVITIFYPVTVFVSDTLVNIHTMYLHCGGFIVSIYLMITKVVKLNLRNLLNAFYVFLVFVGIASLLNIIVYNSGVLKPDDEVFNMFYISPYFNSELPVFGVLQENLPYFVFLLAYIIAVALGGIVIYGMAKGISKLKYILSNKILKKNNSLGYTLKMKQ